MVLCFDIGNTDIDAGVFKNGKMVKFFNIPYEKGGSRQSQIPYIKKALADNGIDPGLVEDCALCSVVKNTTDAVAQALEAVLGCKPLLFKNDCGLEIKTDNPDEVGLDILVACLAVKERYRLPAIVIDMGTATSITAMDKEGAILGVSIITGVMTTLNALRQRTGLAVDYSLSPPPKVIATNTPDSIASGIVYGSAYQMDGMIQAFQREMGEKCYVYATGGLSEIIMPLRKTECHINAGLLLEGMYIYYENHKK